MHSGRENMIVTTIDLSTAWSHQNAMRLTPAALQVQPAPPAAPTPTRRPPSSRSAAGQRGASLLLRPIQFVDGHLGRHECEGLVHRLVM